MNFELYEFKDIKEFRFPDAPMTARLYPQNTLHISTANHNRKLQHVEMVHQVDSVCSYFGIDYGKVVLQGYGDALHNVSEIMGLVSEFPNLDFVASSTFCYLTNRWDRLEQLSREGIALQLFNPTLDEQFASICEQWKKHSGCVPFVIFPVKSQEEFDKCQQVFASIGNKAQLMINRTVDCLLDSTASIPIDCPLGFSNFFFFKYAWRKAYETTRRKGL